MGVQTRGATTASVLKAATAFVLFLNTMRLGSELTSRDNSGKMGNRVSRTSCTQSTSQWCRARYSPHLERPRRPDLPRRLEPRQSLHYNSIQLGNDLTSGCSIDTMWNDCNQKNLPSPQHQTGDDPHEELQLRQIDEGLQQRYVAADTNKAANVNDSRNPSVSQHQLTEQLPTHDSNITEVVNGCNQNRDHPKIQPVAFSQTRWTLPFLLGRSPRRLDQPERLQPRKHGPGFNCLRDGETTRQPTLPSISAGDRSHEREVPTT